MTIRERREALGWSRADLSRAAAIDRSVIQLVELGQYSDEETETKLVQTLMAAEQRRASDEH